MHQAHVGIIGLSTMGASLARNAAGKGHAVAVFNRTTEKMEQLLRDHGKEGAFIGAKTLEEFCVSLASPRVILLMVKAGSAIDDMIASLVPLLSPGDILVDAGNSFYRDTERREKELAAKNIHFVGMGVSGGEEGALLGPSMMPGGNRKAVETILPLLLPMAADDGDGGKCIAYMGPGGAGHFVKMVHNGIEYGIMQLIAETYDILKSTGGLSNAQLARTFDAWNKDPSMMSFLLEITATIFAAVDPDTGKELIDVIKDRARQKGTGKWTTEAAFELGQATPTIDAAVAARISSAEARRDARDWAKLPIEVADGKVPTAEEVRAALECATLCVYNQGFQLIERASDEYGWSVPMHEVARIWRGGCIIRASLLEIFQRACDPDAGIARPAVERDIVGRFAGGRQQAWRHVVAAAASHGVPFPAFAASLSYYDTIRRGWLPQNLIQAQRDYFGAHTYERVDKEGTFHTEWK